MPDGLLSTRVATAPAVPDHQQPAWPDADAAARAVEALRARPGLVPPAEVDRLGADLELVARRGALVLQSGDCAELFSEATPDRVDAKVALLHGLAGVLAAGTGLPVVRIGRMGGQYAKPRSSPWEVRADGTLLPSYRGDAVNGRDPDPAARAADPGRLLTAYDCAARVLDRLRRHGSSPSGRPVYASHEMLLLDYERPLRRDRHASSAHFLWIGERTRQADGPHAALAASVANPIGVKLGPAVSPAAAVELSWRLNPEGRPGRLTFIVRMGADRIRPVLPAVVRSVARFGAPVVWLSDPMHGNTVRTRAGVKTRSLPTLDREVEAFVEIVREHGEWPGGLHLEATPEDVVECVDGDPREAHLPRYTTACDPRLNARQAARLVSHFAARC
jgi:3-deoxy-7-phosphoheptulonate synthase